MHSLSAALCQPDFYALVSELGREFTAFSPRGTQTNANTIGWPSSNSSTMLVIAHLVCSFQFPAPAAGGIFQGMTVHVQYFVIKHRVTLMWIVLLAYCNLKKSAKSSYHI